MRSLYSIVEVQPEIREIDSSFNEQKITNQEKKECKLKKNAI